MCAELADLAMQLARAAASRALTDLADPEAPPAAVPQSTQTPAPQPTEAAEPPSLLAAEPHQARATAPRASAIRIASPTHIDPALLFTRLAAVVRDCIALEARLAAGLASTRGTTSTRALPREADPRRAPLRAILDLATQNHPARATLNRDITARLEEHLQADPFQTINPAQILDAICDEFGVDLDLATISDDHLDVLCGTAIDGGEDAFDPRATSPP
jgi:hypothetical protein